MEALGSFETSESGYSRRSRDFVRSDFSAETDCAARTALYRVFRESEQCETDRFSASRGSLFAYILLLFDVKL